MLWSQGAGEGPESLSRKAPSARSPTRTATASSCASRTTCRLQTSQGQSEGQAQQGASCTNLDPVLVQVQQSHGLSPRRIGLVGSSGEAKHFLVQYAISHYTRSDERMLQLFVLLNRLMAKSKVSKDRAGGGLRLWLRLSLPRLACRLD